MAREKEKRNVLSFFECFLFFYFFLTKNFLVLKTQEKTQLVYRKGELAWLSLSLSPDLSLLLCTVVFDLYQAAAPAAAAALASASAAAACCSLRALRTCDGGLARPPSFFMLAPPSEVEETEGGDGAWATAEAGRGGARAALAGGLRLPNTSIGASEAEEAGTAAAAARAAGIGGAKGFCVGGGRGGEEAIIVAVGGVCGAVVVARGCWFWLSFCCFPRLSLLRGAAAAAAAAAPATGRGGLVAPPLPVSPPPPPLPAAAPRGALPPPPPLPFPRPLPRPRPLSGVGAFCGLLTGGEDAAAAIVGMPAAAFAAAAFTGREEEGVPR